MWYTPWRLLLPGSGAGSGLPPALLLATDSRTDPLPIPFGDRGRQFYHLGDCDGSPLVCRDDHPDTTASAPAAPPMHIVAILLATTFSLPPSAAASPNPPKPVPPRPHPGSLAPRGAPWMEGDGFTRQELIGGRTTAN